MRVTFAVFVMLVLVVARVAADPPAVSPASTESIISSLPNLYERQRWKSLSKEERDAPAEAKLAQKMKSFRASCQQLQSLLVKGKPLSDYPGLLAVGAIIWDGDRYWIRVTVEPPPLHGYAGFVCMIDRNSNIVMVVARIGMGL